MKKMGAISGLVENGMDFNDADFETSDDDWIYYLCEKAEYDAIKEAHGGKKPVVVHYIND